MKKLLAILGMITCMVGLCACGQEEAADPNEASMLQFGEATLENIDEIVNENAVEQYASDDLCRTSRMERCTEGYRYF